MPVVAVLNNYPFEQVWQEVQDNDKPDHHLYGINYFHQRNYQVEVIPFTQFLLLKHLNNLTATMRIAPLVGDLDQQWATLQCLNEFDLIYSPCQTQTQILGYLRSLNLIQVPIVAIAHHPINRGKFRRVRSPLHKLAISGYDAFPSLSLGVAQDINKLVPGKSEVVPWGADANYYPDACYPGTGVVAAGRTGRDFNTLGLAASQTEIATQIICLESGTSSAFKQFDSNVQVKVLSDQNHMKYPDLVEIYAKARVLAIPMYPNASLCGLTSLMDALGMGKPVIMTRHPFIDLDIEAECIGKWVEPGDIAGWRAAIHFFEANPDEATVMGKRAKQIMLQRLNSQAFANQIMDLFDRILGHSNRSIAPDSLYSVSNPA
jgi:glycosyltransferase involved in cell wall biosynthesis